MLLIEFHAHRLISKHQSQDKKPDYTQISRSQTRNQEHKLLSNQSKFNELFYISSLKNKIRFARSSLINNRLFHIVRLVGEYPPP